MGGSIPTPTWPPAQQCPGTSMATAATWHTGQGVVMPPGPEHATWPRHCEPGQGRQEVSLSCCGHSICQASSWACLITWSLKATHWAHEGFQPSLVICRPNEQWQQGTSLLLGNPPGPLDCSSLGIPAPRAHQLLASLQCPCQDCPQVTQPCQVDMAPQRATSLPSSTVALLRLISSQSQIKFNVFT